MPSGCHYTYNDVERVDDTGDVTQDCEQNVDQEISAAATLEEDSDGWQDDGEDDFDDVAVAIVSKAVLAARPAVRRHP